MIYLNIWIVLMMYIVEYLIAYKIFTEVFIKKLWKKTAIFFIVTSVFLISALFVSNFAEKEFVCFSIGFISGIISFLIFTSGTFLKRLKGLGIALGLCICLEYLAEIIGKIIAETVWNKSDDGLYRIPENAIVIIVLLVIMGVVKKKKYDIGAQLIRLRRTKILTIVLAAGVVINILSINVMLKYIDYKNIRIGMLVVAGISTVCVEGLFFLILFLQKTYERQRLFTERIKEMAQIEKRNYESLLEKEVETRRFRHDINKHFIVIKELADQSKTEEIIEYMNGIEVKKITEKKNYEVGNTKINAITNHYMSSLDKDAKVEISGVVSENTGIDDASLCVIYGNLLKNAVEAVNNAKNMKYIIVKFDEGSQFLRMSISNTVVERMMPDFKTKKDDKINHGLGILNVKEELDVLGGKLEYEFENNMLKAEVTIPKKSK